MIIGETMMLRGAINGVPVEYTFSGWVIDISHGYVRATIADFTASGIGAQLRSLRAGDSVQLKLWLGNQVEYDGPAEVQMIRFRAPRTSPPHFRVKFLLKQSQ
jgi:hypothetical protein